MTHSEYFQESLKYFWDLNKSDGYYTLDGEYILIPDGEDITSWRWVKDPIVKNLWSQGLPPFGSLLLALIGMSHRGDKSMKQIEEILRPQIVDPDDLGMLTGALKFLQKLQALPTAYRSVSKNELLVLRTIFRDCHNIVSVKDSKEIAKYCLDSSQIDWSSYVAPTIVDAFSSGFFYRDFRTIALLNSKFKTTEDIIHAIASLPDVSQLNIELEEDPQVNHQPLDLIDELINNDKTFTTGSLVRWLWGGLNIPVHSALPSEQPLGGVSDLTNKGNFDQLLISEFAYDDITFLSRLANNEALYLHREIPPTSNNLSRIILIDVTIKNWGTPKIIAFAVMLAIAHHPKTDISCEIFVLGGEKYYPVSIGNIHEIITGIQIVASDLNASKSLALILHERGKDLNKEIFLITEPATFKDPNMLRVMNDHHDSIDYLIFTDADGNVDLYKRHQRSRKHLQHLQVPLQELWKHRKVEQQKRKKKKKFTLREVGRIPILLDHPGAARKIVVASDGEVFQLSRNWAILKLANKTQNLNNKGWILMYSKVQPASSHFEIGISKKGDYVALTYNDRENQIVLINLTDRSEKVIAYRNWVSPTDPSFVFNSGVFFHGNHTSITLDGVVTDTQHGHSRSIELQRESDEANKKYDSATLIFKNINNIYINQTGHLVFNIHELTIINHYLRFIKTDNKGALAQAKRIDEFEFVFNNGSKVEINRNGFVILRHHDLRKLPPVYIPTSIGRFSALATQTQFAGNEFYRNESLGESQEKVDLQDFYRHTVKQYIKDIVHQ